jgi:hypothetical protein
MPSAKKRKVRDDEILSDEDEEDLGDIAEQVNDMLPPDSEDENETAQQKKLRLTKKYLEELENMDDDDEDNDGDDNDDDGDDDYVDDNADARKRC